MKGGNKEEGLLLSRSSRKGEGLKGGNESKEKKEQGCDIDRE